MINIMLVDDHKMFRDGIKKILEATNDMVVIAEVGNGIECMTKLHSCNPDIILLDINMPEMNGIDTLKSISRKKVHKPKVLIVTSNNKIDCLLQALDIGVDGYILKTSDSKELIRAIHIVMKDEKFIQPSLIPLLNSKLITYDIDKEKIDLLSKRELEILKLIAMGNLNKDIGYKLKIKERTVKNHLTNIYRKLDCNDRTQAAVFCIRNGIITVQD
jgi:DNA-binding NarL/FixJ family response regulator